MQYKVFFIYDSLCPVRLFSQAGPINDKSWNLNQCTVYANVTINNLWKNTHS